MELVKEPNDKPERESDIQMPATAPLEKGCVAVIIAVIIFIGAPIVAWWIPKISWVIDRIHEWIGR